MTIQPFRLNFAAASRSACAIFLLAWGLPAQADPAPSSPAGGAVHRPPKTFYVSQSSGDDNLSGEAAATAGRSGPWKTLAKVSAVSLVAGDRILLKSGDTWKNEELRPKGNGTAQNPVLIAAYGSGPKPVIDGEDYQLDRHGIRLDDQQGFKIVGLEFYRCMTGIYAEYSAGVATRSFIWIEDCYFHESLAYGGYQKYPSPKNIGLGICFFSHERDNRIVLKDIMIRNCVFRRLASAVWTNSPDNFNKNASSIYNFGNLVMEDCLFEEGKQWQQGIRGVAGGAMRRCVTHDIGRIDAFRSFNGVAGSMFFRCKDWIFEDCEWGFVDIGGGSGDGEAFDFEGNCDNMTMKNCLFHDTDGPGFLLCCYASDPHPNKGIRIENCVINGKSKRPIGLPRCAIVNTTDWTEVTWTNCRFYLSPGEALMKVMDPEKDKHSKFVDCLVRNLSQACASPNLARGAKASASSAAPGRQAALAADGNHGTSWQPAAAENAEAWLELTFATPQTISEFLIDEDPSSAVSRYVIECWDPKAKKWLGCFNGGAIGKAFIAPIVSRSTTRARLRILQAGPGTTAITEFGAYHDLSGPRFNDPTGAAAVGVVGK